MRNTTTLAACAIALLAATHQSLAQQRMPTVTVTERRTAEQRLEGSVVSQQTLVGPNNQPEWTTQPNFTNSRVYVKPPGQVEIVQFWTPEFSRHGGDVEHAFRTEVEIGLPYRFQLDLYQNYGIDAQGKGFYSGSSVELRYALAKWGVIPLNPTLYGEWTFNDNAPDVVELKLLLGQSFAKRWQFASNVTYEQETGGVRETEWAVSAAVNYAVIDRTLNIGVEALWVRETERGSRSDPAYEFLIGPSINIKPTRNTFINIAPLFGTTEDSPAAQIFVSAGIRFGGPRGASDQGPSAPASMFGR